MFMRKRLVKFRGELECGLMRNPFEPRGCGRGLWRVVEGAVNFGGVEILCDQRQRIEFRAGPLRVYQPAPVRI